MKKHNILILTGGGGTEHDISLISAKYINSQIDSTQYNVYKVEITKNNEWVFESKDKCELTFSGTLKTKSENIQIHAVIPCLHGYPGETGDIQSYLDLIKIPYLGCKSESSIICFNKLVTKLLLENAGLETTPFIQVSEQTDLSVSQNFLAKHKTIFIKATNQGSSIGCYKLSFKEAGQLEEKIKLALTYSPYVILEKAITGRELEIAAFEYSDQVHLTKPGEIKIESDFYDYEQKYSDASNAKTLVEAPEISRPDLGEIFRQAKIAFDVLQLRHLARIDFFLTDSGEIYINEVNTFPGHTNISMFPMMMENYGVKYSDFINQNLYRLVQK